jgi:hypothetical protein
MPRPSPTFSPIESSELDDGAGVGVLDDEVVTAPVSGMVVAAEEVLVLVVVVDGVRVNLERPSLTGG